MQALNEVPRPSSIGTIYTKILYEIPKIGSFVERLLI